MSVCVYVSVCGRELLGASVSRDELGSGTNESQRHPVPDAVAQLRMEVLSALLVDPEAEVILDRSALQGFAK